MIRGIEISPIKIVLKLNCNKIRKQIIANLISHTSPKLKDNSEEYLVSINDNTFKYSMEEYNDFVNKKYTLKKARLAPHQVCPRMFFIKVC